MGVVMSLKQSSPGDSPNEQMSPAIYERPWVMNARAHSLKRHTDATKAQRAAKVALHSAVKSESFFARNPWYVAQSYIRSNNIQLDWFVLVDTVVVVYSSSVSRNHLAAYLIII